MKTILVLAAILVAIVADLAAPAAESEDEIRALMAAAEAGWNEGDLEAYMQCYRQSDDLAFVGGDRISRGWQAVLDGYRAAYPDRATMGRLTFSDLEITVLAEDAALVLGRWRLDREGDEGAGPHGVYSLVLRRFAEGWRIVHDHTSAADEDDEAGE